MEEDEPHAGTLVQAIFGECVITIHSDQQWTPEVCDHMLTRARRQMVAAARQLGITPEVADAEAD